MHKVSASSGRIKRAHEFAGTSPRAVQMNKLAFPLRERGSGVGVHGGTGLGFSGN